MHPAATSERRDFIMRWIGIALVCIAAALVFLAIFSILRVSSYDQDRDI